METIKANVHSVSEKQGMTKNRKIFMGVILVILGLVIGLLMNYNSPSNRVIRKLELAQKYLVVQNYEEAILAFEQVIEIEPANVEACLGLAQAYVQQGKIEEALRICEAGYERTKDHRLNVKRQEIEELISPEKKNQEIVSEEIVSEVEEADTGNQVRVENGVVYFPFSMEDFGVLGHGVMEDDFQKLYQSFANSIHSIDEGDEINQEKLVLNNIDKISGEELYITMQDLTGTMMARIGVTDGWNVGLSLNGLSNTLTMSCGGEFTETQQNITEYTQSPFQIGKTTYQEWQRAVEVDAIKSVSTGIELDQYGSMLWEFTHEEGQGHYEYHRTENDIVYYFDEKIDVFREQISLFNQNHQPYVTYMFTFRKSDDVLCGITVQTSVQNVPN